MDADILLRRLDAANNELEEQKDRNEQLNKKLEYSISEQRSSAFLICELRKKLDEFREENDLLKKENEILKVECGNQFKRQEEFSETSSVNDIESRKTSSKSNIGFFPSVCSSCSSQMYAIQQKELEKIHQLEKEILSITREKKQLKTHLHWLSRQRNDEIFGEKYMENIRDLTKQLSLEEGNGMPNDYTSKSQNMKSNQFRSEEIDANCFSDNSDRSSAISDNKTADVISKLRKMKLTLFKAKEKINSNNNLSDEIFRLSFQNLRHPYEPLCYSTWSESGGSRSLSLASLDRNRVTFESLKQQRVGYYSLESFSPSDANMEAPFLGGAASSSSPEINLLYDAFNEIPSLPKRPSFIENQNFRNQPSFDAGGNKRRQFASAHSTLQNEDADIFRRGIMGNATSSFEGNDDCLIMPMVHRDFSLQENQSINCQENLIS